jgi:hypothetical protein
MRHYEILCTGTLPYFPYFENKPPYTMHSWPTSLQLRANRLYAKMSSSDLPLDNYFSEWKDLSISFKMHFDEHLLSSSYSLLVERHLAGC